MTLLQSHIALIIHIFNNLKIDLEAQVIKPPFPSHSISLQSTHDLPTKEAMALDNGNDVIW